MPKRIRRPFPLEIISRLLDEGVLGPVDLRNALVTELRTVCVGCQAEPPRVKSRLEQVARDLAALTDFAAAGQWEAMRELILAKQPYRFTHPELAGELVKNARRSLPSEPRASDAWAWAGLLVAKGGETQQHQERTAQALAFRANAARVAYEFDRAEELIGAAWRLLDGTGTYDAVVLADVESLEGLLRRQRRQFDVAIDLLSHAAGVYAAADQLYLATLTLNSLSLTHSYAGDSEQALSTGTLVAELAEVHDDHQLRLFAHFNVVWYQCLAGQVETARQNFELLRQFVSEASDEGVRLRVSWLEGRLLGELGHFSSARALLWTAYHGFIASAAPYEAVQVALTLAKLASVKGQPDQLAVVAEALGALQTREDLDLQLQAAAREAVRELRSRLVRGEFPPDTAHRLERDFRFAEMDPGYRFAA